MRNVSDDVRDLVEQDKALCSAALDGDRDVLLRALEMIRDAEARAPSAPDQSTGVIPNVD